MKQLCAFISILLIAGCVATSPTTSKSEKGNLELNVYSQNEEFKSQFTDVYIDGIYFGNISERKPILYLKEGMHTIRIEHDGYVPVEKEINVSGMPNHQVLNIRLRKK